MDDGMKYSGDVGDQLKMKLNSNVNIKGGATEYSTNNNIAVVSNGTDTLTLRLAKDVDLGDDGTITAGTATMGSQTVKNTRGTEETGNYVTGLDNKTWDKDNIVSGRAATEDQLKAAAESITDANKGGGFGLKDGDGNEVKENLGGTIGVVGGKTEGTETSNISTKVNNGQLEISLNKDVDLGKDGSIKAGDTTINSDGVTTNKVTVGNTTIDNSGITLTGGSNSDVKLTNNGLDNGGNKITNVADGEISSTSKDAINGSQLYTVQQKAEAHSTVSVGGQSATENGTSVTGGNLTLTRSDNANGGFNYDVKLADDITIGQAGENGADGKIGVNGKDGSSVVINGADGSIGLKGADGKSGIALNGKDGSIGLTGADGKTITIKGSDGKNGVDGTTKIERINVGGHDVATLDDGMKYTGDMGDQLKMKLNSNVNIQGGAKTYSDKDNIAVVSDGTDTLTLRLAKDIEGLNSVTTNVVNATTINTTTIKAGDTTINSDGVTINNGPTITKTQVDVAGNKITNVAPGENATDAVNVGQLVGLANNTNHSLNKLGNRINRVGAGAAALAALHPLDFDPDEKWDFAAGYGNYRGANAASIGAFYRPNEDTMFSIGGSFGGGENMVNAGVSFKVGQGNHVSTSRVAMAKEIKDQRKMIMDLQSVVNTLCNITGADSSSIQAMNKPFPDVPDNHWAYEYVKGLAEKGIIEGYPDGLFKGGQSMTRYEFAAMLYRALQKGFAVDAKALKEFAPELEWFRVDTIHKDKDGVPTVERVRTIERDNQAGEPATGGDAYQGASRKELVDKIETMDAEMKAMKEKLQQRDEQVETLLKEFAEFKASAKK